MEFLSNIANLVWTYGLAFIFILSAIVFVHEMGHYVIARFNGVRVDVFSIGFGPEIYGWTARSGTRWKVSLLPLGGYVKMFGDANVASTPSGEVREMTAEEREVSFYHKRIAQRSAIVIGGPLANFVLAVVIYAFMFAIIGQPVTSTQISAIVPDSPAEAAGFMPGDRVVRVDDTPIAFFEEFRDIVRESTGVALDIAVVRDGAHPPLRETVVLTVVPAEHEENIFGDSDNVVKFGRIGVKSENVLRAPLGPVSAVWAAMRETANVTIGTFKVVGQMITGSRDAKDLGGIVRIAALSKKVAEFGMTAVFHWMALLSINLGLINLFPIPMLDGGHLLLYGIEAARGKPLGERVQEYCFRFGLAMVLSLMLFATWNDLVQLKVVEYVVDLFS
jgi:regulator of sigma E protease